MVARHLLFTRQDAAVERIARHAESLGGNDEDVVEAVERVRHVHGPDEQHTRVFRTEAVADLMDLLDSKLTAAPAEEKLEDKSVSELRHIGREEGVPRAGSLKKSDLVEAIRENREAKEDNS